MVYGISNPIENAVEPLKWEIERENMTNEVQLIAEIIDTGFFKENYINTSFDEPLLTFFLTAVTSIAVPPTPVWTQLVNAR